MILTQSMGVEDFFVSLELVLVMISGSVGTQFSSMSCDSEAVYGR